MKGIPDIARHTSVTVQACQDDDNYDYPRGLVCAAEAGQDSCQGDSGGPLMGTAAKYSRQSNHPRVKSAIKEFKIKLCFQGCLDWDREFRCWVRQARLPRGLHPLLLLPRLRGRAVRAEGRVQPGWRATRLEHRLSGRGKSASHLANPGSADYKQK